jgi:hypothetical protein
MRNRQRDFRHNGKNLMGRGERQDRGVFANLAKMENGHNGRNFERHLMPMMFRRRLRGRVQLNSGRYSGI